MLSRQVHVLALEVSPTQKRTSYKKIVFKELCLPYMHVTINIKRLFQKKIETVFFFRLT